jgi:hypothetical protein
MKKLIIGVDFDGTIAESSLDLTIIGLLPGARDVLQWVKDQGHIITVWTCRSGDKQKEAEDFLKKEDVPFDYINENVPDIDFKTSRKIFYDILIDDRALGMGDEVDWGIIKNNLMQKFAKKESKLKTVLRARI